MFYFESGLMRSKAAKHHFGVENCIIVHTVHPDFETAAAVITWLPLAAGIIIHVFINRLIRAFKILLFSRLLRAGTNWYPQCYKNCEDFDAVSNQRLPKMRDWAWLFSLSNQLQIYTQDCKNGVIIYLIYVLQGCPSIFSRLLLAVSSAISSGPLH